jgi:hypothetical protein
MNVFTGSHYTVRSGIKSGLQYYLHLSGREAIRVLRWQAGRCHRLIIGRFVNEVFMRNPVFFRVLAAARNAIVK